MPTIYLTAMAYFIGAAAATAIAAMVRLGARDRRMAAPFATTVVFLGLWNLQLGLVCLGGEEDGFLQAMVFVLRFCTFALPATALRMAVIWSDRNAGAWRWTVYASFGAVLLCSMLHLAGLMVVGQIEHSWGRVAQPGPGYVVFVVYAIASLTLGLAACVQALRRPASADVSLRVKYLLAGMAPAVVLGLATLLQNYRLLALPLGSLGVLAFFAVIAYATVRHRLMDIDFVVIRAGGVVLPIIMLGLPLAAGSLWLQHEAFDRLSLLAGVGTAATLVVGMIGYARVRLYVEAALERALFPARYEARRAIEDFSREIVEVEHRGRLGQELTSTLAESLGLTGAALYRRSPGNGFVLEAVSGSLPAPARVQPSPGEEMRVPANLWELTQPILDGQEVAAFIALGSKVSGAAIDEMDVTLLAMVASQVGIALKNVDHVRQIELQKSAIERQKAEIEELKRRVEAENVVLRAEVQQHTAFREIIGSSPALQRALGLVEKAARSEVSILIAGETGTGKELIARAIHELSERRAGPMICVNCPAIPHELAEAELFGAERGAYTGATESRPGRFELADGGTIFLDEIAELPWTIQKKLLRVLQEREIQRLGSGRVQKVDVRVVAATNRDLHQAIARGEFREDLYHRLAAIVAELPPLRERAGDIEMLATYFLDRAATTYQKPITGFTAEAVAALRGYSWPGNIRELQNVIERAVLLCDGDVIAAPHLADLAVEPEVGSGLSASLREEKTRRIREALAEAGGNQAEAARRLGMSRSNLFRMMKALGLKSPRTLQ